MCFLVTDRERNFFAPTPKKEDEVGSYIDLHLVAVISSLPFFCRIEAEPTQSLNLAFSFLFFLVLANILPSFLGKLKWWLLGGVVDVCSASAVTMENGKRNRYCTRYC